jgi:hypothetical protein
LVHRQGSGDVQELSHSLDAAEEAAGAEGALALSSFIEAFDLRRGKGGAAHFH